MQYPGHFWRGVRSPEGKAALSCPAEPSLGGQTHSAGSCPHSPLLAPYTIPLYKKGKVFSL